MPEYKEIVAILATLVASFAGAWAAFLLESQRRKREASVARKKRSAFREHHHYHSEIPIIWRVPQHG